MKKRVKTRKFDTFFGFFILITLIGGAIAVLYSKNTLSNSNIKLERVKSQVEKQENINESLKMKINELASLSNVQSIASEHGLSYNNDNIIIVK